MQIACKIIVLLLAWFLFSTCASAQKANLRDAGEFEVWLDDFVAKNFPTDKSGQLAFVIIQNDKIFFQKGYGFADAERKISVSPDKTVFFAASLSKLFTATAIMQLSEQGKINLDSDVNKYLKDFQIASNFPQSLTIANLLTHTNGLDENLIGSLAPNDSKPIAMSEYFKRNIPIRVVPNGQQICYSNLGMGIAGHVVEQVSGKSFDEYIEQNILAPLQMSQSSFRQPLPPELYENLTGTRAKQTPFMILSPAGSLAMTTENMAHFLIAQLNGGKYGEIQILKPETLAEMQRQHFSANPKVRGVAYGFFETSANGKPALFHTGDRGHHSLLYLIPQEKIGFYLVANGSDGDAVALREKFTEDFLNRYFPTEKFELPNPPNDFAARAKNYVGTFRIGNYSRTTLTKIAGLPGQIEISDNGDGTLSAELFGGELKTKLVEIEPNVFRSEDKGYFTFQAGVDGRTRSFTVTGGISDPMTAEKIAFYEDARFHIGIIIAGILLVISRLLLIPFGFFWRRFRKTKTETETKSIFLQTGWKLSGVFAFLIAIAPLILIVWLFTRENGAVYEIPWAITAILSVLLIASLIGLALPVFAFKAWCESAWTLAARIYYSLLTIAAFILPFFLNYWNLLGFRY